LINTLCPGFFNRTFIVPNVLVLDVARFSIPIRRFIVIVLIVVNFFHLILLTIGVGGYRKTLNRGKRKLLKKLHLNLIVVDIYPVVFLLSFFDGIDVPVHL
jgi:hypothetical protein